MGPKLIGVIGTAALLSALAQNPASGPSVKIITLQPPVYPSMAIAARVAGEVNLKITLPENGIPATVQVESGPQMLRPAAVESAKRSKFEAVSGDRANESYELVYRFALDNNLACDQARDSSYPHIKSESNTVTISEQSMPLCDPAADQIHVRSWKCLYLWKCRTR